MIYALLAAVTSPMPKNGYANPSLLVETDWVQAHAADPNVRLVDMRAQAAYHQGHIPGAVRIPEEPLRNPEDRLTYLPPPTAFAAMMSRAGIGNRTHVVVYDDQGGKMAARLWYVLSAYGHTSVSLVNGGWSKWLAEGHPGTTETPSVTPTKFTPRATPAMTCPTDALLARQPNTIVLDVRTPEEYAGAKLSPGAAREGRIPGAVNVEWKSNVTGPNMVFKPADELRAMYAAKGITPDKQIVTHCASGGRAAQTLFALKLLGYPHVRIYYGSFADYSSRPDAPVEKE